ncbi:hypothetical protein V5799_008255 [Amblyomma americanum]|uniref:Fatty acid synthase n=1 Tax=Amblyomma americanum TaxID=6943 RepID=A0AAQ4FDX2_AMBAM
MCFVTGPVRFLVNLIQATGEFVISEAGTVVCTGRIRMAAAGEKVLEKGPPGPPPETVVYELDAADFYKELRLRGYEYQGAFQGVLKTDLESCYGRVKWEDNWVTFIDNIMQLSLLPYTDRVFRLPVKMRSCRVDPNLHKQVVRETNGADGVPKTMTEYAFLNVETRGDLSSLRWYESPLRCASPSSGFNGILCSVYYAPVNSRDVLLATGKLPLDVLPGVDVVLNSLSGEKLEASVRCLAPNGRFLEVGKFDVAKCSQLGMSFFRKSATFCGIHLEALHGKDPAAADEKRRVRDLVEEGIVSGTVRPLDTVRFRREEAEEAFRFTDSGEHTGKVILEVREEETTRTTAPASFLAVEAAARTWVYEDKSYVIIGGLGGFGLELANWMVGRGCRSLLLSSRSGVRTGYQKLQLRRWHAAGAKVRVTRANASTACGARKIIDEASTMGAVGGIFNLGLVLRDALLESQSPEAFEAVCRVKVDGTRHLDELSRKLCPELDHFVAFSSLASGHGNIGQTGYGYANAAMERICERRVADGFPDTWSAFPVIFWSALLPRWSTSSPSQQSTVLPPAANRILTHGPILPLAAFDQLEQLSQRRRLSLSGRSVPASATLPFSGVFVAKTLKTGSSNTTALCFSAMKTLLLTCPTSRCRFSRNLTPSELALQCRIMKFVHSRPCLNSTGFAMSSRASARSPSLISLPRTLS